MAKLAGMAGVWRGPASGVGRDGQPFQFAQTERVGPMLDGDLLVVEGRGYDVDGAVQFNALGLISWDEQTQQYAMHSYAQGRSGTFDLKLTADGYVWEIPAGPGGVVRYTATLGEGTWHEVGAFMPTGGEPHQIYETTLTRVGDTDWPEAGAILMD